MSECPDFTGPICSVCGYSLRGLPEPGHCPECGSEFGPNVIVLRGVNGNSTRKHRLSKELDTVWTATWCIFFVGLTIASHNYAFLIVVLLIGLANSYRLQARWRGYFARLDANGYGQRIGIGPINIDPWNKDDEITLEKYSPKTYLLVIRRNYRTKLDLEFVCDQKLADEMQKRLATLSTHRVFLEI